MAYETTNSLDVSDLDDDTEYLFRVKAENKGEGIGLI